MPKRKSRGNPLTKGLSRLIDKVGSEVVDGALDVATGHGKGKKESPSADTSTDWHTRAPAAKRARRGH